jgi:large subunit ribosomal protein L25
VPVVLIGDAAPATLVTQELSTVQIEADALNLPEHIEVSIAGAQAGQQVHASDLILPEGASLISEATTLIAAINAAPTAEQMDSAEAEVTVASTDES